MERLMCAVEAGDLLLALAAPDALHLAARLPKTPTDVVAIEVTDEGASAVATLTDAIRDRVPSHPVHVLVLHDGSLDGCTSREGGPRYLRVSADELGRIDLTALLETGWTDRLDTDPWAIVEHDPRCRPAGHWETVLGMTNGYLGCRATQDEHGSDARFYDATFANGVFSRRRYTHPASFPGFATHYEGIVNLVSWRLFDTIVDGRTIDPTDPVGRASYDRRLDLRRGLVRRRAAGRWAERELTFASEWFVSSLRPEVAAARYEVRLADADESVPVALAAAIDRSPTSNAFGEPRVRVERSGHGERDGGSVVWHLLTVDDNEQRVAVAIHTRFSGTVEPERSEYGALVTERATVRTGARAEASTPKARARVERILAIADGSPGEEDALLERCRAALDEAASVGYEGLRSEQEAHWAATWDRIDVEIDGPEADQQALRYALFQLASHAPARDGQSVPATGLVGDGYGGQIFWDTEIYMVPFYALTEPELARRALLYRYDLLPKARKRARELAGRGALFAWNSIDGEECGVVFEASTAEYHLNCAVAYALWQYWRVTADDTFLRDVATPIVWETAIFLSHLGEFIAERDGAFCLNVVCGPDEYACGVDNNAYSNYMAHWHFGFALELLERWNREEPARCEELRIASGFDDEEVARIERARERFYLPKPNADGVIPQDDSYFGRHPVDMRLVAHHTDIRDLMHPLNLWRIQVSKQADVLLLFLLRPDLFDCSVKRTNYDYYEPRTNHGSSLSPAVHSIVAQEIGERRAAYDYFRLSSRLDLDDVKRNAWKGLHVACLGGTWMSAVAGFAGLRVAEDGLRLAPDLPDAWRSMRFRLAWQGSIVEVRVDGEATVLELMDGPDVELIVYGETVRLCTDAPRTTHSHRH